MSVRMYECKHACMYVCICIDVSVYTWKDLSLVMENAVLNERLRRVEEKRGREGTETETEA